jgi:hypothetical protein
MPAPPGAQTSRWCLDLLAAISLLYVELSCTAHTRDHFWFGQKQPPQKTAAIACSGKLALHSASVCSVFVTRYSACSSEVAAVVLTSASGAPRLAAALSALLLLLLLLPLLLLLLLPLECSIRTKLILWCDSIAVQAELNRDLRSRSLLP